MKNFAKISKTCFTRKNFHLSKTSYKTIEEIDKEISMNPNDSNLYHQKGKILFNKGKFQEAFESYLLAFEREDKREYMIDIAQCCEKILELNPTDVGAMMFYGGHLETQNEYDKAILVYQRGLEVTQEPEYVKRLQSRIKYLERKKISKEKLF